MAAGGIRNFKRQTELEINMTTTKGLWCVVYCGAPYGDNELGEIVSRHKTESAALAARDRLQSNPKYYGSNSRVEFREI